MLGSDGTRSVRLGVAFLGLSGCIALVTIVLLIANFNLMGFGSPGDGSDGARSGDGTGEQAAVSDTPSPTPPADPIPEDMELSASSAIVLDPASDTVLFERVADEPAQPASTAKIFSALVVLRHASPEEVIEIVESDVVDPVVESSMGLQAGDRVTVHDLLVGLMLPSGNDAANALARVIGERIDVETGGLAPEERFVQEMNAVAEDLGLSTTHLDHPAGYDQEGQSVTARELAVATEALLQRPSMGPILSMKEATIQVGGANPRAITVESTNELLVHEQVFGVKTGTTAEAGQCLVVASRHADRTRITVILGSQDRYGDARALLDLPAPAEPENAGTPESGTADPENQP